MLTKNDALGRMANIMPLFFSHMGEVGIQRKGWWSRKLDLLYNVILHFRFNTFNSSVDNITFYQQ